MPPVAQNIRKRRRDRASFSMYRFLVAAPADLGALALGVPSLPVRLPAYGDLAISAQGSTVDFDLEVDVNGTRYPIRALKSPTQWEGFGWHERDRDLRVVLVKGANPGLVSVGVRGPTNPHTHGYATFATAGVL